MKYFKYTVLLLAICTSLEKTNAQEKEQSIGIEGGFNMVSIYGSDFAKENYSLGLRYLVGLSYEREITNLFSFKSNLFFERKGFDLKINLTDQNGINIREDVVHSSFDYITLPLLVKISGGNKFRYFANAGPYVGYLTKAFAKFPSIADQPGQIEDYTDSFKKYDFGLSIGGGIGLNVGTNWILSLEARYNHGLYAINDFEMTEGAHKTKSTNFMLGVSHILGKCKKSEVNETE